MPSDNLNKLVRFGSRHRSLLGAKLNRTAGLPACARVSKSRRTRVDLLSAVRSIPKSHHFLL